MYRLGMSDGDNDNDGNGLESDVSAGEAVCCSDKDESRIFAVAVFSSVSVSEQQVESSTGMPDFLQNARIPLTNGFRIGFFRFIFCCC